MSKSLFITEKPSVAKEFARALKLNGKNKNGYIESPEALVTWCIGHLVTMSYPEKYNPALKKWSLTSLPFLPETYRYEVISEVKNQFLIVKDLLTRNDVSTIYVCTDSGREGEYIYRLVDRLAEVSGKQKKRVWINSQTDDEIIRGVKEAVLLSEYDSLSDSAYLRAIEDYAAGINFSRLLTLIYSPILSRVLDLKSVVIAVGRVMSCVLGMIVTREREVRNFVKTPFFKIKGNFITADGLEYSGEWKASDEYFAKNTKTMFNEKGFLSRNDAETLISAMQKENETNPALIENISRKKELKNAPLLYNLAELQNECSKLFKINPDEALQIAQKLYEQKLATYPRTDARVLSTSVLKEIRKNITGIAECKCIEDLPGAAAKIIREGWDNKLDKKRYVNDTKITDHYAIIPTGQGFQNYPKLSELEKKVFSLISRRFLAIFFPPAEYSKINVTTKIGDERFYTSESILIAPGYQEILSLKKDAEPPPAGDVLKNLKKNKTVKVDSLEIKDGETTPPRRYTSGSIILAMENAGKLIEDDELREHIKGSGIGTSATRAEIIKKLERIRYIQSNSKTQILTPTDLGELIYEVLNDSIGDLLDPRLTASWEKGLKMVANKEIAAGVYRVKLENYIRHKTRDILNKKNFLDIQKKIREIPFEQNSLKKTTHERPDFVVGICPACGRGEILTNSKGYGCNKWKEGCKFFLGTICGVDLTRDQVELLLTEGKTRLITGFKAKNGKEFDAFLEFQNGKVNFKFIDQVLKDIRLD